MKSILVSIDGSGAALRALEQAVRLAKASAGCKLHLVHAHEEPLIYGEIAVYVPRAKMATLQREISDGVLAAAEAAARLKESGVPYSKEVVSGSIGQAIAGHAERLGCDLIVMGRHGSSTVGQLFMGSVAMKVLHATQLPVLLVR
jgi:nucleotide-binding universal stress UspA family protein